MKRLRAAALAVLSSAQAIACPLPAEVMPEQLHGLWRAEFEGLWAGATLLLEKHPEYVESLSGAVNRGGERSVVSGELEDGEFTMEESRDGQRIAATWAGAIVEGSCGREIRGTWQADGAATSHAFVMRKLP